MDDYRERLALAVDRLAMLRDCSASDSERLRLAGKAQGVALALSYFDEMQRAD